MGYKAYCLYKDLNTNSVDLPAWLSAKWQDWLKNHKLCFGKKKKKEKGIFVSRPFEVKFSDIPVCF